MSKPKVVCADCGYKFSPEAKERDIRMDAKDVHCDNRPACRGRQLRALMENRGYKKWNRQTQEQLLALMDLPPKEWAPKKDRVTGKVEAWQSVHDPHERVFAAIQRYSTCWPVCLPWAVQQRGWSRAVKKVVMGDGAEWIWNLADQYFPRAIHIVDLFHARQHLWELARKLHPNDESGQNRWMMVHQDLLDNCKMKKLVTSLRSIQTPSAELTEKLRTEAEYFRRNARRMRYPKFRRQHLFVGTGVIEAGFGSRCKQSGMFWTVRGANAILALRCCQFNRRFEDYWEARRA